MTNRKKMLKKINELSNEDLIELLRGQICPYDNFEDCLKDEDCKECLEEFFQKDKRQEQ